MPPTARYWQAQSQSDWSDDTKWNTKSDGTGQQGAPEDGDDVYFGSWGNGDGLGQCDINVSIVRVRHFQVTDPNSSRTISAEVHNPDIIITGSVAFGGDNFHWKKGTGIIKLMGASTVSANFHNKVMEHLQVNKDYVGDTVTFTDGWNTAKFEVIQGTLNFGGAGDHFRSRGDFYIGSSGRVVGSSLNGCNMFVPGTLTLRGTSSNVLDLVATADWDIYWDDDKTPDVQYVEVAHSKAHPDDGITYIATSNSIDLGDNEKWAGLKFSWYRLTADLWDVMVVNHWEAMLP